MMPRSRGSTNGSSCSGVMDERLHRLPTPPRLAGLYRLGGVGGLEVGAVSVRLRKRETAILRVRQGDPLPDDWRVVRILQTLLVPVGGPGTASVYEYEVEVERWRDS
jgi:hypothetical protein